MRPDSVMLFAAGLGTRMGPLTRDMPKPLIKVAGKTLLDHALDLVDAHGVRVRVANVHYKPDALVRHLSARGVAISDERNALLETGGGLKKALPLLGRDPLFTMNTDAVWQGRNPLDHLSDTWDPDRMDGLLLCVPKSRARAHSGSGDFDITPDGQISRGTETVYSGLQIIRTDLLADIPDAAFSLRELWFRMMDSGRLYGTRYLGHWCDVGTPEGIAQAEAMLEEQRDV